jgi:hypothetical protein
MMGYLDDWYGMAALVLARTNYSTYARERAARTYVDSGIGLVKKRTGVREQP